MRKLMSFISILLVLALAGCENVSYHEDSSQEELDRNQQLESQLPDIEFDNERDFVIFTDSPATFLEDETTPEAINTAIIERNAFLRAKYGANVVVQEKDTETLINELDAAQKAGKVVCDMISVSAKDSVKLYTLGLLGDMNLLPEFNLENGFFDKSLFMPLATNNSLYLLADPCTLVYDSTNVIYFNRNLVKSPEIKEESGEVSEGEEPKFAPDVETLAMQGKWTWDKFNEYARASAPNSYSSSGSNMNTDNFGFGAEKTGFEFPAAMWVSANKPFVSNSYKTSLELSMDIEETKEIAQYFRKLYSARGRFPLGDNSAKKAFEEGRIAFYCNDLNYLYTLRDGSSKGEEYGILPIPKYSEEQENYRCLINTDAHVISVPKTLETADEERKAFVSAVISATCGAGGETAKDAYLKSMLGMYLNNNAEVVLTKTIVDSAVFDFTVTYGSEIYDIARGTINAVTNHITEGVHLDNYLKIADKYFKGYCDTNFQ
ncbi:MAG: extracellular solute-binding protein [Ruminococcaceae bacterium]|nr:extracellular solute-binding protein [Oscillospiraceae bacterium]